MPLLSTIEVSLALTSLPGWEIQNSELTRTFTFTDFRESMSFVNLVAALAERAQHHPDIDIRYNKVRLALVSHDAGGITDKDVTLATDIEDGM